jgi:Mrp family chromosome partitioning ATPase
MADGAKSDVDTAPWHRAVTKILAFAEERRVRMVGIVGDRPGVGVSLLCRELALAYARNGIAVALVDASRVDETPAPPAPVGGPPPPLELLAAATPVESGLVRINLAEHLAALPSDRAGVQRMFEQALAEGVAIVVDLPAIKTNADQQAHFAGLVGSTCQLAYLVCMSGVIKKAELRDCMEQCKINQIPIEGIIINDWKQPAAWLATEW